MKKHRLAVLLLALWAALLAWLWQKRTTDELYPRASAALAGYQAYAYDDHSEAGGSSNQFQQTNGILRYQWQLNGRMAYPYIGGGISWIRNGHPCVDLGSYDSLFIRWRLSGRPVARLALHTFDSARSEMSDPGSLRILMAVVPLGDNWQVSRLGFADWSTPPWWYSQHRTAPKQEERFLERSCELEWDVPGTPGEDQQGVLEISEVLISRPYRLPFWLALAAGILAIAIGAVWGWRKKPLPPRKGSDSLGQDVPVELPPRNDWVKLETYLKEHYHDSEISAESLCKHFGWNATKFTAIVKEGSGMNFKQALNRIRIGAASTLLRESQESVSMISERVGFSNVTHFNRVFKELQGKSPSEFREQGKSA